MGDLVINFKDNKYLSIKNSTLIVLAAKAGRDKELSSFKKIGIDSNKLIDIQLENLGINFEQKIVVLGEFSEMWKIEGYEKIINKDWQFTSSGYSLSLALPHVLKNNNVWILYADILFRKIDHSAIKNDGNLIFVDSCWENRIFKREQRDDSLIELVVLDKNKKINLFQNGFQRNSSSSYSEMCGLIRINYEIINKLIKLTNNLKLEELKNSSTSNLLEISRQEGVQFYGHDISGKYCQLNIDEDLKRYYLGTKAETLSSLNKVGLKSGKILDQVRFTVGDWKTNHKKIIKLIINHLKEGELVIRSSNFAEDNENETAAGKFESELRVKLKNQNIKEAVDNVILSYGKDCNDEEQLLVQRFLDNVDYSGVAFSRNIQTNGPYIVINLSKENTSDVTSGRKCDEIFISRNSIYLVKDKIINRILECIFEVEELLKFRCLDFEFAIKGDQFFILQVRKLKTYKSDNFDNLIFEEITNSSKFISKYLKKNNTIFSLMTDWNPAEIIGKFPSKLSSSIYKYIITDEIWSEARKVDGYKKVFGNLLFDVLGSQYVDVGKSIESFIPQEVKKTNARKIKNKALSLLRLNKHQHDKLEFNIIPTCLDLDWQRWEKIYLNNLKPSDLESYKIALKKITRNCLLSPISIKTQPSIKKLILSSSGSKNSNFILENAIKYLDQIRCGLTLDFARAARRGFIVASLLKSAKNIGILDNKAEIGFYKSVKTVSYEYLNDIANNSLGDDYLIERYGHLRPNTYNLESACYYKMGINRNQVNPYELNHENDKDILAWQENKENFLQKVSKLLDIKSISLLEENLYKAVDSRERIKFEFSKYVSASLELIADWGVNYSYTREELSYLSIFNLKELINSTLSRKNIVQYFDKEINRNQTLRNLYKSIYKPDLLVDGSELYFDLSMECKPTYVGTKIIESKILVLDSKKQYKLNDINGKIICIENADPGYDFIFGYKIAGLITMYGGSNSHMSIRCSELSIPAVIGVGPQTYADLSKSNSIQIDCNSQTLSFKK